MNTPRTRRLAPSRLRPLAAALALASVPLRIEAVTSVPPGEIQAAEAVLREDGTPLRTALRTWHLDAVQNPSPPTPAATRRYVTSCADDGDGSLRQVLAAVASGDTVDLGALSCSAISLETGAIAIRVDTVTLVGPDSRSLAIDGMHADRVFLHYGGGSFTVRDLTVRNGYRRATGYHLGIAGCIASAGYLTLDHSTVSGCYAGGEGAYGGAIYAYSLLMASSTLSSNVAYGVHPTAGTAAFGGAAFVYQLDMVDTTVTGNRARHRFNPSRTSYDIGGGICTIHGGLVIGSTIDSNYSYTVGGGLATFGDLILRNSTISDNTARTIGGGGLFMRFPSLLDGSNSTITSNSGSDGAGILFTSQYASLQSTIVAGNTADRAVGTDLATRSRAVTIDGTSNLIGAVTPDVAIPPDSLRGDPGLLPLAYNGGPTRTHALRAGSAAIDAGSNVLQLPSDQRGAGFARVVGAAADIGAFEFLAGASDGGREPVPALSTGATGLLLGLLGALGLSRARARSRAHARDA